MKREQSSVESFAESSRRNRRLLRQEQLILEATELLSSALEEQSLTKAQLAARLEKSKGFVSQILSGSRNITLRTLADVADALDCRVRLTVEPSERAVTGKHRRRAATRPWSKRIARWPNSTNPPAASATRSST